jgi:dolichyl-phosphate-mannose-protein mannosyltransferase
MTKLKPLVERPWASLWAKLNRWEYTPLSILLLIVLMLHFSTIMQPQSQVFDEQYYVPAAKYILQGEGTDRTEHPPLGQLIITAGVLIFGDNPLGWRIFSIIFGVAGLAFFYLIGRQLGLNQKYAYLATFLLSFENLSFILSSVAMLDVFSLTFILASFWLYLKSKYVSSGLMVALATLCKLTGILALPIILLHWFLTRNQTRQLSLRAMRSNPLSSSFVPSLLRGSGDSSCKQSDAISSPFGKGRYSGIFQITLFLVVALVSFFLLMPLLEFSIWHKWLNPLLQLKTMLTINAGSTFAAYPSEMLSRPWDWLIRPEILTFWIEPHYIAMISPPIWVLIIPAIGYLIFKLLKRNSTNPANLPSPVIPEPARGSRSNEESGGERYHGATREWNSHNITLFALLWFAFTYLVWIPISLISDRISYIYYIYPAIGPVCLATSLAITDLERVVARQINSTRKKLLELVVPVYMLLILGAFVILSPIPYWWKLPLCVGAYIMTRHYLSSAETHEYCVVLERQN